MNAEPITETDTINAVAFEIAGHVYGGVSDRTAQWETCIEAAKNLLGKITLKPQANRWVDARNAFEAMAKFNIENPTGSFGTVRPDYGQMVRSRIGHAALVFPQPRTGQQVMAWFEGVGWVPISHFTPDEKKPALAQELTGIGMTAKAQGKNELARIQFNAALAADPKYWHAMNEIGVLKVGEHDYRAAISWYDKALAINPNSGEIHNNRGTAMRMIGEPTEAIASLRKALELLPDNEMVPLNLASAIEDTGDIDGALAQIAARLQIAPADLNAHYNKGLTLLCDQRFAEGWPQYEYRMKQPMVNVHYEHYGFERLKDGVPKDADVLVWDEQGLGDTMLLISMLPSLLNDTPKVTYLCQERLIPIVRRSFPNIIVAPRPLSQHAELFKKGPLPPELLPSVLKFHRPQYQMSQGDLGNVYRRSLAAFTYPQGPLLKADMVRRDRILKSLPQGKKVVGISWHSRKNPKIGDVKEIPIEQWGPIFAIPNVTFVCLQYGDVSDDIAKAKELFGVDIVRSEVDILKDLDGFASLVAAMDLVVSSSNTTIHFAGALDVPCWVMTPHGPGKLWYFFNRGDTLPWYKSVRLFRQEAAAHWTNTVARVAAELTQWAG